jgi:proteasome assembly chaperone (PAC2) family protein
VRLTEGRARAIDWPETVITAAHIPGADRDLVFLQGVEPSLRWRTFTRAIADAASELGVKLVLTLGALLADVPHSRAVNVSGLASDQALIDRLGLERPIPRRRSRSFAASRGSPAWPWTAARSRRPPRTTSGR